jgi:hypothetical protein
MARLVADARTNWAMVQTLAHEVGHHLSFHEGGYSYDIAANHGQELEADYFSGYILARMGASLQDATSSDRAIEQPASATHPSSAQRIAVISQGWREALGQSTLVTGGISPSPSETAIGDVPKRGGGFGQSYWDHNGSTMLLVGGGSTRKISRRHASRRGVARDAAICRRTVRI